jgi:hypothetical protein
MVKVGLCLLLGLNWKPGSLLEQIAAGPSAVSELQRNNRRVEEETAAAVQLLLDEAKTVVGQVGSLATDEQRARMEELALDVIKLSELTRKGIIRTKQQRQQQLARYPLVGVHNLVYSAAPGASSGRVFGNVVGRVSQLFEDDEIFYNRVDFGPVQIALRAQRKVLNDTTIKVSFLETSLNLFGRTISKKDVGGGGIWKVKYVGTVKDDDGNEKLVRIMETPSLFVLEQDLSSSSN